MNIEKKRGNSLRSVKNFLGNLFPSPKTSNVENKITTPKNLENSEEVINFSKKSFDSVEGLRKSLTSISALNEMLSNRRAYLDEHKNEILNEFVLFGCFWLDRFGQIWSIEKSDKSKIKFVKDVEDYKLFKRNNPSFTFTSTGFAIPKSNSICPYCGRLITIDDLRTDPCICANGLFYHDSCYSEHKENIKIKEFSNQIINRVYNTSEYTYQVLPNEYMGRSADLSIMYKTVDGNIVIRKYKSYISIEWQANYKPFEINKLFSNEDVTKWEQVRKRGARGINASSNEKACEYLKKARNIIPPYYSKY